VTDSREASNVTVVLFGRTKRTWLFIFAVLCATEAVVAASTQHSCAAFVEIMDAVLDLPC